MKNKHFFEVFIPNAFAAGFSFALKIHFWKFILFLEANFKREKI
ncbi:MAG TPA: hypothetical protein VJC21_03655 [Candidatus Nanoarchaeia archaeon]|nr:hypothetical protein [Candidatus Nanoarchaeia archaeon]